MNFKVQSFVAFINLLVFGMGCSTTTEKGPVLEKVRGEWKEQQLSRQEPKEAPIGPVDSQVQENLNLPPTTGNPAVSLKPDR